MGVVTAAIIGTAGSLYAQNRAKKAQKDQNKAIASAQEGADPFGDYRAGASERLNNLSTNPDSIRDSGVWKARMQAAERTMASQGYTGSGNAMIAAADAGASAYQQEFDNLARLSGADVGIQSKAGVSTAGFEARQKGNDQRMSAISGVANNLDNLTTTIGEKFNKPATAGGG